MVDEVKMSNAVTRKMSETSVASKRRNGVVLRSGKHDWRAKCEHAAIVRCVSGITVCLFGYPPLEYRAKQEEMR